MAWISNNYGFEEEQSDLFYQKVSIHQLSPELSQVIIFGIIIAKNDVRRVISRKQPGTERYVLNFTLRDSLNDTINAVCWGEEANVKNLSSNFTIGDVVKIKNPQIMEKQAELQDDKFRPPASSHYILNISALYSEITSCLGDERKEYKKLLHCAMNNSTDIINLADVIYNSQNADGLTLNLLVAIKDIKPIQNVKLKNGRDVKKLLIFVFDQTHSMFPVMIWEEETANFIIKYCCRKTVLLITNIRISYNTFMKEMAATAGGATIFTPEPEVPDARVLYQYTMKISIPNENTKIKCFDSSKMYTIDEICKIISFSELEADNIEGKVYAVLTSFDIDGDTDIFSLKCPGCYQALEKSTDKCTNGACEIGSGIKFLPPEKVYNITVSLTDYTTNLSRCMLAGQTAENLLGLKVKDFNKLSREEKTTLKWKYLFEWFTIQFKVSQSSSASGRCLLRIIQMQQEI